ncbi:MAG: glycosyltransferase [Deltaproteobacteria bacterium]|nr:MAG: glycosyltransferase [Deltaproteobacteria bacterium]
MVGLNISRESLRRVMDRLGYSTLATLKDAARFRIRGSVPFFGFIRRGRTTAAFMKARKLADLFVPSSLRNGILYVCSGNIPLSYCLRDKKRGVKLVLNQNGVYYPGWYGQDYAAANERHLAGYYRAADYIFYQSFFCEEAARHFLGEPLCPHEILHNPVDTAFFTSESKRAFDPAAPVFLATGNFYHEGKATRLAFMLEAFTQVRAQLPGSRLIIAGFLAPALVAVIARTGPGVSCLGPYLYEQAPALYRQGDIYLNTQFNDNCPSAVLEAMSCGLPVVHLSCGGTPELTGEAGIAVAVEQSWERFLYPEPEDYAAAMLEAVRQRDKLSAAARGRCLEKFDVRIWKARHEKIFAGMCR